MTTFMTFPLHPRLSDACRIFVTICHNVNYGPIMAYLNFTFYCDCVCVSKSSEQAERDVEVGR